MQTKLYILDNDNLIETDSFDQITADDFDLKLDADLENMIMTVDFKECA